MFLYVTQVLYIIFPLTFYSEIFYTNYFVLLYSIDRVSLSY